MNSEFRADLTAALDYCAIRPLSRFAAAIDDLTYWQEARERHGIGTIGLSIFGQHLILRVSSDLVTKILPF